jgi:hypothetical protein
LRSILLLYDLALAAIQSRRWHSRTRSLIIAWSKPPVERIDKVEFVVVYEDKDGRRMERPWDGSAPPRPHVPTPDGDAQPMRYLLDDRL